jgi:hypothetical protein
VTTAEAEPQPQPQRQPNKGRRLIGWGIALGVLVVLLVVGYVVGEAAARSYATGLVRDELATAFDLDAGHPMDIDFGGGSLLLQAASGTVDGVDVAIDDVPLGDITGDITLAATGIPLDTEQPAKTIAATATVDEANVAKLRDYLSGVQLDSITLGDGVIDVATTVKALFLSVPVSASIAPSAADGELVFTPESITVNGAVVSIDDLRSGPLASVASGFLGSRSFCIAQYLPSAITLDDVSVTGDDLVLEFSGENVALGGSGLSATGTCG